MLKVMSRMAPGFMFKQMVKMSKPIGGERSAEPGTEPRPPLVCGGDPNRFDE